MNILLAVDSSDHSLAATETIANRPWPPGSAVKILSVVRLAVYADCGDQITARQRLFAVGERRDGAGEKTKGLKYEKTRKHVFS